MAKAAKSAAASKADYNGKTIETFLRRVMECHDELDTLTGAHMNRCAKVRQRIDGIVEEAKAKGIPSKIFKLNVSLELDKRKMRAKVDKLESEEVIEARLVAEARDDKTQMSLFGWTKDNKPTKKQIEAARSKVEPKADDKTAAKAKPKGKGDKEGGDKPSDGSDLTANGKPPAGTPGDQLKGGEFAPLH